MPLALLSLIHGLLPVCTMQALVCWHNIKQAVEHDRDCRILVAMIQKNAPYALRMPDCDPVPFLVSLQTGSCYNTSL